MENRLIFQINLLVKYRQNPNQNSHTCVSRYKDRSTIKTTFWKS